MGDVLYPKWKDILEELWEERKKREINLVCLIGGIGVGKTSVAGVIQCLMVFDLLSKFNPQKFYGLDPDSIIAIMSMSITTGQARKITFGKVYPKIVGSPFFRDYFPADPRLKREIRIPKAGISIFPGTSSELSALGFDLYGACLTGGTEILTTDGVRKIKDLVGKKNIGLYSYNINNRRIEESIGKGCYKIGLDHVYRIKLDDGQKIKATINHGFLVRQDNNELVFKKLKDLKEGNVITIFNKDGVCHSSIKVLKYCGIEIVYDIADVQPNHNYISGSIISHNTVDEANFLEVIEDSKRTGTADVYDAAEEMYNAVWTRMTSRFMRAGKVPGMIVMISSPRYPDDFLERKVQQAKEMGDKSRIFYKRLKMWDAKPQIWQGERIWSGDKFRFDVEEMRIIEEGDPVPTNAHGELHEIITPPIELKTEFEKSPERSLRDLDARPLLAISPYFRNKGKVKDALKKTIINPFNEKNLTFDESFKCDDNFFRYIHIDLGLKKDAVGIAMTHIPRFIAIDKTNIVSGNFTTEILNMPEIIVDFVGRVTAAQPGEEILFSDVQEIIYQLTDLGFFIQLISFDKFQCLSKDTKLKMLDGTFKPICDITEDDWVYSYDTTRDKIVPSKCKATKRTGIGRPTYEVMLDNGKSARFTDKHPMLMRDGSYKMVKNLDIGDSLMPFEWIYVKNNNSKSYHEQIEQSDGSWKFTHGVVMEEVTGRKSNSEEFIHHGDFNSLNNKPSNLERLSNTDHIRKHGQSWKGVPKTKEHSAKVGKKVKIWWDNLTEEERRIQSDKVSVAQKGIWKRDGYKDKMTKRKLGSGNLRKSLTNEYMIDICLKSNTLREASDKLNCSYMLIFRRLKNLGYKGFSGLKSKHNKKSNRIFISNSEFFSICDSEDSGCAVADKVGCSFTTVYNKLKKVGYAGFRDYKNRNNHRVVSVKFYGYEDVYDIEVPKYHNFGLECGVFVHNSSYIQQQLRDDGYTVAELSMDRTSSKIIVDHDQKTERGRRDGYRKESTGRQYTAAYQSLKDAMYEDRIKIPYHEHLLRELLRLESIRKNNIDLVTKPNKGSDDVAQALAGSVFNAVCNEIPMVEVDQDRGSGKDSMYDDFYDNLEDSLLDDGYTDDGDGGDDFYERYND